MIVLPHKTFSEACDSFIKIIVAMAYQMIASISYQKEQRKNFELRSKIKNREKGYRQFVKSIPFPVIIISKADGVIFQNKASIEDPLKISVGNFHKVIGSLKNGTGKSLEEIINNMKVEEEERKNSYLKLLEENFFSDYYVGGSDSRKKVVYKVSLFDSPPILDHSDVFTLIMCDNTLKQEFEEQKMAEKYKNILLCSFSHEIRTPINIVIGTLKALKNTRRENQDPSVLFSAYNMAITLSWKINEIIDMIKLNFDEFELHPEPIDLYSMANKLITFFQ